MNELHPTPRSRIKRLPARAAYDLATLHAILDEGFIAHVAIADGGGQPFVLPMVYARDGDRIYLHGSPASRLLRALATGTHACVTVTLVDGLVLARSAFHHSVNFRSVVLFGRGREVTGAEQKQRAFERIVEHVVPGRWPDARQPNAKETRGTLVVEVPIDEASAKVRSGPPVDDDEDLSHPVWAGVLPLRLTPGDPVTAEDCSLDVPACVHGYTRPGA
jgi:hypothetical protein